MNKNKRDFPCFCKECGSKLLTRTVRASKLEVLECYFDCEWVRLAAPFNKMTGEKTYAEIRQCPHWKDHFWWWNESKHVRFVIYDNEAHDTFKFIK